METFYTALMEIVAMMAIYLKPVKMVFILEGTIMSHIVEMWSLPRQSYQEATIIITTMVDSFLKTGMDNILLFDFLTCMNSTSKIFPDMIHKLAIFN
jgi:hypothetical protein